ncbi:MAG: hypothetical protein IKG11_04665, partial [Atopobiaceae bacterium]|nr:hypothetical protein [Atopobiaceae bacterium]
MRKSSGGTHMSQRALLKTRVREVSEKLGNVFLSVVLVLSLVPTASIAYAADEDPEGTPIEEKASETGGDSGQGGEGQGSDTGQGGEGQGSDTGQGGEGQGSDTGQGGGVVQFEEGGDTVQGGEVVQLEEGGAKKAGEGSSLKAMADDEDEFVATVYVDTDDWLVQDGTLFSKKPVTATMFLRSRTGGSISDITVDELILPEGVTATENGTYTWDLTITNTCNISDIQLVLKPYGAETPVTINALNSRPEQPDKVVIDEQAPTVQTRYLPSKDSTEEVDCYKVSDSSSSFFYNCILETNPLYIKLVVEDDIALDKENTKAEIEWSFYSSEATGSLPGNTIVTFEEQDDGSLVGFAGPFTRDNFYVNDNLIYGTLSYTAVDLAGRVNESAVPLVFTSESKEVLAALDTVTADAIKVSSDGKYATRDGKTVYNKEVTVSLDGIADSLSIVAKFNGMTLSGSAPYTVTAVPNKNASHELEFSFTYTSNLTKAQVEKTITKAEAPQLAFDIDTTTPVISVEMNDPSVAATESNPAYYNKENPPKVKVNVENDSTLNTDDPYEFILVKGDDCIPLGKLTADADGYYTIPNLENDVTYSVR